MPWQATFFIVGLPGLILSVLFFLLHEPARSGGPSAVGGSLPDMLKHVLARWRMYGGFVSVFCFMTIVAYSQGWGAALFDRTWVTSQEQYAAIEAAFGTDDTRQLVDTLNRLRACLQPPDTR